MQIAWRQMHIETYTLRPCPSPSNLHLRNLTISNPSDSIMSKVQTLTSVGAPGVHSIKSSAAKPAVHTPLKWTLPPSGWTPSCHPKVNEVTEQVDGYFLKHWPFPNEHARKVFRSAEFSRVTCLYFPLAKDDRIQYACRLLTILFLIDGRQANSRWFASEPTCSTRPSSGLSRA